MYATCLVGQNQRYASEARNHDDCTNVERADRGIHPPKPVDGQNHFCG
jgi:hypothetical protein